MLLKHSCNNVIDVRGGSFEELIKEQVKCIYCNEVLKEKDLKHETKTTKEKRP